MIKFWGYDLCLIIVEVHPLKPTKESTFAIWYLESEREVGFNEGGIQSWKAKVNEKSFENKC